MPFDPKQPCWQCKGIGTIGDPPMICAGCGGDLSHLGQMVRDRAWAEKAGKVQIPKET